MGGVVTDDELLAALEADISSGDRWYYLGECLVLIVCVFAIVAYFVGAFA